MLRSHINLKTKTERKTWDVLLYIEACKCVSHLKAVDSWRSNDLIKVEQTR